MPGSRIVLFGGSFNPIHNGHLIVGRAAAELLSATRLIFIPSPNPPHKAGLPLADANDRLEMVRLAIAGEAIFDCSGIEIERSGPSYTVLTIEQARGLYPGCELVWLIGADSLAELHAWHRVEELVDLCRIVTVVRPGFEKPDLSGLARVLRPEQLRRLVAYTLATPSIDISATEVRRRVAEGRSIRYLVPEPVGEYISRRGLYSKETRGAVGDCPRRNGCR